jgi:hypothetical protein
LNSAATGTPVAVGSETPSQRSSVGAMSSMSIVPSATCGTRGPNAIGVPPPAVEVPVERVEPLVAHDAVDARRDAGDHGGVRGIRDGGHHAMDASRRASPGERTKRRHGQAVSVGIEIDVGHQPVDAEHDHPPGIRARWRTVMQRDAAAGRGSKRERRAEMSHAARYHISEGQISSAIASRSATRLPVGPRTRRPVALIEPYLEVHEFNEAGVFPVTTYRDVSETRLVAAGYKLWTSDGSFDKWVKVDGSTDSTRETERRNQP